MEYKFSNRVQALKPSAIREIFKYAADPEVVSLSAGNPSPEAFPVKEIEEISAKLLRENPIGVLQYGISEGYPLLRKALTEYMREKHNVGNDEDDILITTGAQQIMDLTAKSLVNEGDVIITEAPSFIGSLNTFRSYNAKLVGVPVESDGMDMTALENALKENKNAKFNPLKFNIDGFTFLVGRNNKENDYLTLKYSKKTDLWFHTKDIHGSHGVLILDNKEPSKDIILKCAEITAYHSKARMSSNVPVDTCKIKFVKKPKGAKPGMVIYTDYKTLYVTLKEK